MFDNKFLITLIGLIVAVVAINNIKSKDEDIIEGWWGNPSKTYKVDVVGAQNLKQAKLGNFTSLGQNRNLNNSKITQQTVLNAENAEFYNNSGKKGDFFTVPGTFQSQLPARMSNVDYGANIRYNMPSRENLAVPVHPINPLTFGGMASRENFRNRRNVKEDFCSSCGEDSGTPSCAKGGEPLSYHGGVIPTEPNYASGNFMDATNNAYSGGDAYSEGTLPPSDMTDISSNDINGEQTVVYSRLMVVNRNSRGRALGDPIRGDLAIVPCDSDWFRPSANPHVDLQQGALNAMCGVNNEQGQSLDKLIYDSSGLTESALSGINENRRSLMSGGGYSKVNMGNQYGGGLSAIGDVGVTAFV